MQEVFIKINEKVEKISASLVFASKNPKTNQYSVNISFIKDDKQKNIRLLCRDEDTEDLVTGIRNGKISDLTEYVTQEVDA